MFFVIYVMCILFRLHTGNAWTVHMMLLTVSLV